MGLDYNQIKRKPTQILALTGFTRAEFDELTNDFKVDWDSYISHYTLTGKVRQRIPGKKKLDILKTNEDKLLFILAYLKTYPIQELHAANFSMTQPQCNFWIHLLIRILFNTLKRLKELPTRKSGRLEEVLANVDKVFLDGTERPIQRSKDSETQKEFYSGKKNS